MKKLFPEIRPFRSEMLEVGDGHQLYVECSGVETGIPVVVIHGGPGAGCSPQMRRFFDPERYQIVLFDQRGAGRSVPHASIDNNTTQHTLADLERLREHLNINRWVLFGGSFGATIALHYALQSPDRVSGLILRGVFLGRQQDLDWLYKNGASRFNQEEWLRFIAQVEHESGDALIAAFNQLLQGENDLARLAAAKAWSRWEFSNASFRPSQSSEEFYLSTHTALALATISAHFFQQKCFQQQGDILADAHRLPDVPGYIVHGHYDMICPPEQAWLLAQKWANAELDLVREGGHSAFDPAMTDALIRSTELLARRLGRPDSEA